MSDNAQMREGAQEEQKPAVISDRVADIRNAAAAALGFKVGS